MVLRVQIYETTIIDTWRGLSIYRWVVGSSASITCHSNEKEHLRQDDFHLLDIDIVSVCSTYPDMLIQLGMGERVGQGYLAVYEER